MTTTEKEEMPIWFKTHEEYFMNKLDELNAKMDLALLKAKHM